MKLLVEETGFEVKSIKTVTSVEWLFYQHIHLVTYPKEGMESVFWTHKIKENLGIKKKIFIKLFAILHKLKINHIITKIIDVFGLGDNYVVILKKNL